VILRILAQEYPNSELWLKRYERMQFWGLNWNFGIFYEFIWNIAGALVNEGCNLEEVEGFKLRLKG
jgi:hypothetical protein